MMNKKDEIKVMIISNGFQNIMNREDFKKWLSGEDTEVKEQEYRRKLEYE